MKDIGIHLGKMKVDKEGGYGVIIPNI